MPVDRIESIEAFSIRLPRDAAAVRGTAGSPTELAATGFDYQWSETNGALYSVNFEAALVKVTLESGLTGWGEPQAPLAPDVACLIAEQLLRPALQGQKFDGTPERVALLRQRMYSTMRVRGQTGGFMLDAIAGVDIALWDLAVRLAGARLPVCSPRPAPRAGSRAISPGCRARGTRIESRERGRLGVPASECSSCSTTARKTSYSTCSTACAKR